MDKNLALSYTVNLRVVEVGRQTFEVSLMKGIPPPRTN